MAKGESGSLLLVSTEAAGAVSSLLRLGNSMDVKGDRNLDATPNFDSDALGLKMRLEASIERFEMSLNELILLGLSLKGEVRTDLVFLTGDEISKIFK